MSLDRVIEEQIKQAMAEGKFDDLPGKGKPVDLDWYFQLPEDVRVCYSILKNAHIVPEEMQLLKEVEELQTQLDACSDTKQKEHLGKTISEKKIAFNMLMEKRRRR